MRFIVTISLSLILVFATCKNNNQNPKPLELGPDPTAMLVPDSLKYLLPILDSVWYRDQFYRRGLDNTEVQQHSKKVREWDQKNLVIVEDIIQKHGWLGPREVGFRGVFALFLPIQHSDLKTQEKYLPLIKQAAIDKKITPSSYAMLADRIQIKNKRPQVYGTQINAAGNSFEILPLLNPDSVDVWRKSIHMAETMQQYVDCWHIKWDVESYKKQLPDLMKKYGFQL